MNIFDYAMQMEKDGEEYYRKLSGRCGDTGLRKVLDWLADEEIKHFRVFEEMNKGGSPPLAETNILSDAKDVFERMREENVQPDFDASEAELYRKAQVLERRTREFYLQKSEEVEDLRQKEILLKIAGEEEKHYFLLGNIVKFVSQPETWLENAEFFHMDEY